MRTKEQLIAERDKKRQTLVNLERGVQQLIGQVSLLDELIKDFDIVKETPNGEGNNS